MTIPHDYWAAIAITMTNGLLGLIGYGLRMTYKLIQTFVLQHEEMYEDVKEIMMVVDQHTEAIVKSGWAKNIGLNIPRLERRSEQRKN